VRVPHEGERAAVERFRDGALCPVPHSGGQVSTRLTLSVQPVRATTAPAAVLKTAGEVLYSLSPPPFFPFSCLSFRSRVRVSTFDFSFLIRFRILYSPNSVYSLEQALMPMIMICGPSRSRSGGFNTVNHTLVLLVSHPWRGRLGGGVDDDGGDWWSFPSL
jgi:hypothetical protein